MYALIAIALLGSLASTQAGGGPLLAGSIDSAAVIAGPSGTVSRTGLASVGPVAAPGAIITGKAIGVGPGLITSAVAPGAIVAGGVVGAPALGLGVGGLGVGGLGVGGLGLGLGGLGLAGPGLAVKALGLEGSGIEGQWIPDINEKLYDDGSYKPGLKGL